MSHPIRRKAARGSGFSLVEVMVSLVVLAIGLLGIGAMQVQAMKSHSAGQHLSEASSVARSRIEQLSRFAFASATLTDSGAAWVNSSTVQTTSQDFTRSERITDEGTDLKQLEVRVVWNDSLRANRSVVLSSKKLRGTDE